MKVTATKPITLTDMKESALKEQAVKQIKAALRDAKKGIFGKGMYAF